MTKKQRIEKLVKNMEFVFGRNLTPKEKKLLLGMYEKEINNLKVR